MGKIDAELDVEIFMKMEDIDDDAQAVQLMQDSRDSLLFLSINPFIIHSNSNSLSSYLPK